MDKTIQFIVITAPSGSGKTTIVKKLISEIEELSFSISATTREKRPHEVHGQDYYFLTLEEFQKAIENDEFLEWEEVYPGKFYGTLKSEINRIQKLNKLATLDIDVQGSTNLKKLYGDKLLSFFIKAPSLEILRQRLIERKTDTPHEIEIRLAKARYELQFEDRFDYVIINENLQNAVNQIIEILRNIGLIK
jgi:guanylate kinase